MASQDIIIHAGRKISSVPFATCIIRLIINLHSLPVEDDQLVGKEYFGKIEI